MQVKLNSKIFIQKSASYDFVTEWAMDAQKHFATNEGIFDDFCQWGYIDFDWSIDKLKSNLRSQSIICEQKLIKDYIYIEVNDDKDLD